MTFFEHFAYSVESLFDYFGIISDSFAFEIIIGVFLCFLCAFCLVLPFMVLRAILSLVGGWNG